ncbi:MAG: class I SAM-dependent methyltransferase [Rhodospirillaceae bacterium]|nr:class I SAM-dependent methyltransferase [Rhodospirillaceae bacterium]
MTKTAAERPSYRTSHLGEGEGYHRKFFEHPYRAVIWEVEQQILLEVLGRFVRDLSTARLLDFACGTGRVLSLLEGRVREATGVDVSESMLEVARGELRRSRLVLSDITREASLDRDRFDVIVAFRFFPNAEPELRDEVMAKLSSLLAPDGVLIFNNHLRCGSLRHLLRRVLFGLRIKGKRRDLHCMSDREAAALAKRHGLALSAQRCYGILPIIKERRPLVPRRLLRAVERWFAERRAGGPFASHAIYVLTRP